MVDNFSSYMNMPNNSLDLVLHCELKAFYAYKKACEFVINYLEAHNYVGLIDISLRKREEQISKLMTLAKIRMISCDVTEESVTLSVDNIVNVLREIEWNYVARVRALGHDPYDMDKTIEERIDEIMKYFDELVKEFNKDEIVLKRDIARISN